MDIELTPENNDINIEDLINKIKNLPTYNELNIPRTSYSLITTVKISENIKLIGTIKTNTFDLFVWLEIKNNILLIGLQNMPIKAWYKIKKESEIKHLIDYFNSREKIYYNYHRFYLKTTNDFITIMNYIKNSDYTDKYIYLDQQDEVNKINNDKFTDLDNANLTSILLKSNIDEYYTYTKYSNSRIKFENHKGFIIVELNYNQIKIRNRYDPFDKFLPFDISLLLNNFELKSINDILESKTIQPTEIDICVLLARDKKNLNKLKTKLLESKDSHEDVSEYIEMVINRIKMDEIFIDIENDGIFRSFENSVDILLKTVYERFNGSKDYTYINEILKYKVNSIFYSRFI